MRNMLMYLNYLANINEQTHKRHTKQIILHLKNLNMYHKFAFLHIIYTMKSCTACSTHLYTNIQIHICSACPFLYRIYIFQHEITFEIIFYLVSSYICYTGSPYICYYGQRRSYLISCLSPVES